MGSSQLASKRMGFISCTLTGLLTTAGLIQAAPLVVPPGGAQANISGCVVANATGIFFFDVACNTANVFAPGAPDTGSYAGLTGGTIQNLTGTPVIGDLPTPIVNFATFNTSAGVIHFDLTNIDPDRGTAAGCASNAVGSICTLPGSPVTLTQIAPNSVAISLGLNGRAYLGSAATGTSPTGALLTSQNLIPGTITGIVAQLLTPQGFQSSYSGTFSSVSEPIATCPAISLAALAGAWTFSTKGFAVPNADLFLASGGNFVATFGPDKFGGIQGILVLTQTAAIGGSISRQEVDVGAFQVNSDCTGGTLTFNFSSRPAQFDFFFINPNEIVVVGTNAGSVLTGRATRRVTAACPVPPLSALAGTWVFQTDGFAAFGRSQLFLGAAGRFVANNGILSITQSASSDGNIGRQGTSPGYYQINNDCTGGTLTFNGTGRPAQFDFFFVNSNELIMIDSNNGDVVSGVARRFGF